MINDVRTQNILTYTDFLKKNTWHAVVMWTSTFVKKTKKWRSVLVKRSCVLEHFVILGPLILTYNKRSHVRSKFRSGKHTQFNKTNIISKLLQLIPFMEEELALEKKTCWSRSFTFHENLPVPAQESNWNICNFSWYRYFSVFFLLLLLLLLFFLLKWRKLGMDWVMREKK